MIPIIAVTETTRVRALSHSPPGTYRTPTVVVRRGGTRVSMWGLSLRGRWFRVRVARAS